MSLLVITGQLASTYAGKIHKNVIENLDNISRCDESAGAATFWCEPCWQQMNYEREIKLDANKYTSKLDGSGSTIPNPVRQFKMFITSEEVIVEIKFSVKATDQYVTEKDKVDIIIKMRDGVNTFWNEKLYLVISDLVCGKKILPIKFTVVEDHSHPHFFVKLASNRVTDSVEGLFVTLFKDTSNWSCAHEYGHCFGLPDEYAATEFLVGTIKYLKPNGTYDVPIPVELPKDKKSPPNIMDTVNNGTVLQRHGWILAIEAQKILRELRSNITIKCDISLNNIS